ncbi:replication protein [Actinobacillus pleuropneumoniae]|uniref:replication protein n=1 Tax=Actinobacillus pleuropneumoniae TaxID=715 RepID=UPI003B97EFCD
MALPQSQQKNKPILRLHQTTQEAKKVSVDEGFTAIPNELLKAILRSKVLGWKGSYLLATILKTLSWRKESDWFTHSQVCEMMDVEPTKYHINQLSAARKELIRERVLFEDGKKTGVNLAVFDWEMVNPEKVGSSRNNRELVPEIVGRGYPEKVGNTKEIITKDINNIPPIIPQVDSSAKQVEDLTTAKKSKSEPVDYDGVMQAWNDVFADTPIAKIKVMNEQRKRQVHRLAKDLRAEFGTYSAQAFADYFADFWQQINRPNSWYLRHNSRKWMADFEYVMKPKTFAKTVEDAL